jgi:sugar fermentation stimulation protein A
MKEEYKFNDKLIEGIIKSRSNRFIMMVKLNNSVIKCHCPSTGRIGDIIFENVSCLLSKSQNKNRKTNYTVETISFDSINKKNEKWIGINQTKVNTYIEFFIKTNQLSRIVSNAKNVEREKTFGNSRIDFIVDKTLIEVKTPLISLPSKNNIKKSKHGKFNSFERLIKHFNELATNLNDKSRAIVILCYLYNAKPFKPPAPDKDNIKIQKAIEAATKKGVENWQVNLKIDKYGVSLIQYFKLKIF